MMTLRPSGSGPEFRPSSTTGCPTLGARWSCSAGRHCPGSHKTRRPDYRSRQAIDGAPQTHQHRCWRDRFCWMHSRPGRLRTDRPM